MNEKPFWNHNRFLKGIQLRLKEGMRNEFDGKELIQCELTVPPLDCWGTFLSSSFGVDNVNFARLELMTFISTLF